MKITDQKDHINNKVIKLTIHDSVELIKSIIEIKEMDDYTEYRITKALERIQMFNKKIK